MHKTIIFILLTLQGLSAQTEASLADTYRLLLAEAHVYANYNSENMVKATFIDSAEYYADNSEYDMAIIFLEEFVQINAVDSVSQIADPEKGLQRFHFNIQTGLDFNRQEFEIGYLDSDSLITDQLTKPFVGYDLSLPLFAWRQNQINLWTSGRVDKESKTAALKMSADYQKDNYQLYLDAAYQLDKNSAYPDFSYNEWNSKQKIELKFSDSWRGSLNNQLRYKTYASPSQSVPDFLRTSLRLEMIHQKNMDGNNALQYILDYNESIAYLNNDYFDQTLQWSGNKIWSTRSSLYYLLGYQNNLYTYALEDSSLSNRSVSPFLQAKLDIPLSALFSVKSEYQGRFKSYQKESEQDPDYQQHLISFSLRFRLTENSHLETGYLLEYKQHFLFDGAQEAYVKEQNYRGNGLLLGVEIYNYKQFILTASSSYAWRRYPDAQSDGLGGLYNARNVLNFNIFMQAPLLEHVSLNIFASYDDDRDLDSDSGNIQHSIFSAELQYSF